MTMATWTPRAVRKARKGGDSGSEKKRTMRRKKLANQRWCGASWNYCQRNSQAYLAWCAKIDSELGIRRGGVQ